jgi:hypothetical protein
LGRGTQDVTAGVSAAARRRGARRALRRGWFVVVVALVASLAAPPVSGAATPPANDNYLGSTIVPQASTTGKAATYRDTEDTTAASTQPDLFNPTATGMAFSGGGPEPLSCGGVSYGNTIWYDLHPKVPLGVELNAAGFGTAIALYEFDSGTGKITRRVGCQVSRSLQNDYPVPVNLRKGHSYTVQVGGVATSAGIAAGTLDFKVSLFADRDNDGTFDLLDKCPTLPGVERYGGCPPAIHPLPRYSDNTTAGSVQLTLLRLDQIPGGAVVTARCDRCGPSERVAVGRHGNSATMKAFDGRTLGNGDRLQIFVTKRRSGTGLYRYGAIGSYISYSVTGGSLANRVLRCLMPGSLRPQRSCPAGGRTPVPASKVRRPAALGPVGRRLASVR